VHRFSRRVERFAADLFPDHVFERKIASMPSPRNLSTWPPRGRSEAVSVSNTSSSISMTAGPGVMSAIAVKARISLYHRTARMLSTEPRSISPE